MSIEEVVPSPPMSGKRVLRHGSPGIALVQDQAQDLFLGQQ